MSRFNEWMSESISAKEAACWIGITLVICLIAATVVFRILQV